MKDPSSMDPCPQLLPKNPYNIGRLVVSILQKGVSKSKLFLDVHILVKHRKHLSKAFNHHALCHPSAAFGCHTEDVQASFVSPVAYEFSCSSSPPYRFHNPFHAVKRRADQYGHRGHARRKRPHAQAMFVYEAVEESPRATLMDSRFTRKDEWNIDKAAEEFIDRFYRELRRQKMDAYM